MSKNLTRQGLAFGALVALAASVISGAPASADNNGPITLLPNGALATGATYNSIIGAGLTLDAAADDRLSNASAATTGNDGNKYVYIVKNPGGATITLTLEDSASNAGYAIFNEDGDAVTAESDSANTYAADSGSNTGTTANSLDVDDFNWTGTAKRVATLPFVDASVAGTFVTDATAIVIGANVLVDNPAKDTISSLTVDSEGASTVALKVQALSDETSGDATGFGKVNAFELTSKEETVTLYPITAVSATTAITTLARTASTGTSAVVKTTYGSSVNPHAVSANTSVAIQKDGATFAITSQSNAVSAGKVVNTAVVTAAVASGMYTAQSIFTPTGGTAVNVGAASVALDLRDGEVASIGTSDAYVLSGANLDGATDDVVVRAGTKAVDVIVKNYSSGTTAIEKAGIKYRATVTATKLDATSSATVSGSATKLAATDDVAVAYATSDVTGKVTFAISNAGAVKTDKLTIVVDALTSTGTWATSDTVTLTWAAAALKAVKVLPGTYVSGANPTITFKTVDQFGEPISSTTNGSLMIKATAKIAGVTDTTKLNESKTVVNGSVSFTFANFATTAIPGQVFAKLYEGVTASASSITNYESTVNVYAVGAVNKVTVLDAYTTEITYADFVTGDETDSAVAAKIEKTGIGAVSGATISGTVLDAAGAGLPGAAVDVSAAGVLFYDSVQKIYAQDKITVYANEYGAFSVEAIAHKVNTTGAVVTLASAGTTATTKLKSYFPTSVSGTTVSDKLLADNLKFSWTLPALLVKNTTYALVAQLTDKWGNPIATSTDTAPTPDAFGVTFQGFGSLQVNSLDTEVYKNFDKTGKVTVFVRSVKDIAGPGSLSATLGNATFTAGTATALQLGTLTASTTDSTATAWDETLWSSVLSADVEILDKKPTASIVKPVRGATVTVKNAAGTTVKVVRGAKSKTVAVTSATKKITLKYGKGTVNVYANGVLVASK